jgi:DNA polymerase-3 subunit epsilon
VEPVARNGLSSIVQRLALTADVDRIAVGSRPHRALWDTVAVSMLLAELVRHMFGREVSAGELCAEEGLPASELTPGTTTTQPALFD